MYCPAKQNCPPQHWAGQNACKPSTIFITNIRSSEAATNSRLALADAVSVSSSYAACRHHHLKLTRPIINACDHRAQGRCPHAHTRAHACTHTRADPATTLCNRSTPLFITHTHSHTRTRSRICTVSCPASGWARESARA